MASQRLQVVVERHSDGYIAYPLGINGVVVGQGDTYEEALEDVRSAIAFHQETFGPGPIRSLSWSLSTAADICAGVRGNCLSPRWSRHSRSLLLQPI